jgi:UDP-N-acetylmuramoylalanine--D-glutamate ligase
MNRMEIQGRHILVLGMGATGLATARFLLSRGARVTVTDSRPADELPGAVIALAEQGAALELGGHRDQSFVEADLIVVSPGVSPTIEPLESARRHGIPITGEIELASRFITAPLAAITGTNGKTTTTTLLGEMFKATGRNVFVGGNIGRPLIDLVHSGETVDAVVIEVSSFQLETIETLKPKAAILLNITPDHLNRHGSMSHYAALKQRLFANQDIDDAAILNADDPLCTTFQPKSRRLFFSRRSIQPDGAHVMDGHIVLSDNGHEVGRLSLSALSLVGAHNQENIMAALLAGWFMGLDFDSAARVASGFKGLPHRVELVAVIEGVSYYDDSKGTNVGAVMKSLEGFSDPVVLIAGGQDKAGDFSLLKPLIRDKVKRLILLGEARNIMARALAGETDTILVDSMAEAVAAAREAACFGDVVLLSPACASFDMFDNYGHRGRVFSELALGGRD